MLITSCLTCCHLDSFGFQDSPRHNSLSQIYTPKYTTQMYHLTHCCSNVGLASSTSVCCGLTDFSHDYTIKLPVSPVHNRCDRDGHLTFPSFPYGSVVFTICCTNFQKQPFWTERKTLVTRKTLYEQFILYKDYDNYTSCNNMQHNWNKCRHQLINDRICHLTNIARLCNSSGLNLLVPPSLF